MDPVTNQDEPITPRRKPSRGWYLLAIVLLLGSCAVFGLTLREKSVVLNNMLLPMPRLVAPTTVQGVLIHIEHAGKQNIFYENRGTFEGKTFDTPRRQVWMTYESPAMTCTVTRADSGESVEVRLPGVGEEVKKTEITKDLVFAYNTPTMQGHSAWVFEASEPGDYRIVLRYVDEVHLDPSTIEIPPELTKAQMKEMLSADGTAYEAARRDAIERAALASLEPIDVLFAVGPDPTGGEFFELLGLKGAATVLALGFTASSILALVTLMLRGGHVTPRGKLRDARRMPDQLHRD